LLALGTAERSRALEHRDGGGRMCARSKAGVLASSGSASCAWSARGGDSSQGCCLHALVLSDVAARFCSAGHVRRACAMRHATKVPSTEETKREGVGLAWLSTRDCTDGACWHAARPGHRGAAASRRRQRGSAEAISNGTEMSAACPQMATPIAGRGGVARGDPTGGPWRGAGRNQRQRPVAETGHGREGLGNFFLYARARPERGETDGRMRLPAGSTKK
jgi:hypothetical protein